MAIDIVLRDGTTTQDRRLDRLVGHEPGNLNYPIRTLNKTRQPRSYTHNFHKYKKWLDQGVEGACVLFGWGHELLLRPAEIDITDGRLFELYHETQKHDQWPGGSYPGADPFYEGTSVGAGAETIRRQLNAKGKSIMPEYRWAFGGDDAVTTLGYSPIVTGTVWTEGMFDTDENGFIHPTGRVAGGHCVVLRGVKLKWRDNVTHYEPKDLIRELTVIKGRNSWSRSWGIDGDFLLTLADLDTLLAMDGEVCVPSIRNK